MAQRRDVTARLSPFLASYERRLLRLRAEVASSPTLTAWEDPPLDLGLLLDPASRAIGDAAEAIAAHPQSRSRRGTLAGELSVLWADVIEIGPAPLQRRWGHGEIPGAWPEAHRRLVETVEETLGRLGS